MIDCEDRIKPKLLRDVKTEALLVFVRTTLEQYFIELDSENINFVLGTKSENEHLERELRKLFDNLKKHVVSSKYIRRLTYDAQKSLYLRQILKKEEPLIIYYDSLIKQLEHSLSQGANWIPEQLVFCLLSEWIVEEEKSVVLYSFLNDIDYISILSLYDTVSRRSRENDDENHAIVIKNMYFLGTKLISKLKNTKYRTNTTRKSKFRNKKSK